MSKDDFLNLRFLAGIAQSGRFIHFANRRDAQRIGR